MRADRIAIRENLGNVVESVLTEQGTQSYLLCSVERRTDLDPTIPQVCKYGQHNFERGIDTP
jgi:hypothetical protein